MTGWLTYIAALFVVRHLFFRGDRPAIEGSQKWSSTAEEKRPAQQGQQQKDKR